MVPHITSRIKKKLLPVFIDFGYKTRLYLYLFAVFFFRLENLNKTNSTGWNCLKALIELEAMREKKLKKSEQTIFLLIRICLSDLGYFSPISWDY